MEKRTTHYERDCNSISDVLKIRFYPLTVISGQKNTLFGADGKEYLDFNAGWAVANTGYCHPRIIKAVDQQMRKLSFSSLCSVLSEESITLAEKLKELVAGDGEQKVWFGHSGSDANEFIAKILPMATGKPKIITFVGSYHGQTMGSYEMSGHPAQRKLSGGGNVVKLPFPYCYRCAFEKQQESCELFCLRYLEEYIFKAVCAPDSVAAIEIEPIQSDGGDVVPPEGFMQGLEALCKRNKIYFIVDEVKVGFGRTGKLFGFQQWNLSPDLVVMGKPIASGQPLSAVIGPKKVMDIAAAAHLFTTAGNPVACASALETISIIEDERLCENAEKVGNYLLGKITDLKDKYDIIGDVRGKGMIIGIELVKDRLSKEPAEEEAAMAAYRAYELGLLYYCAGLYSNVLEFTPPLTLTMEEAEKAVKIIDQAIGDVVDKKITKDKIEKFLGWGC